MELLAAAERFFNNQSVSAFLGAFAAFVLVVANDWRRDLRKVKNLRAEVEVNLEIAQAKLETVRSQRSLIREHNQVRPSPILKFNTTLIRQLAADVLDHLSIDQRRAVEALCFTMEAIDALLADAHGYAKHLTQALGQADRMDTANRLLIDLGDAAINLKRLIEMSNNYMSAKFREITAKQYDRQQYEEA